MSLLAQCKTDADIERLLALCMRSTKLTALTFWPEQFDSAICPAHENLLTILDNPRPQQKVVICGSRKSGKTTWLKAFVARCILFRLKRFIFYVSQSETHAMATTEAIKRMFVNNKIIKELKEFGDIRFRDGANVDEEFSKKGWVAQFPGDEGSFGTLVVPRGSGQQVRGILFDHYTPDLVVVDDLEDKKLVNNENIRNAGYDYLISDVGRCFSHTNPNYQLAYLDTHKHEDSVMARVLSLPSGWDKHRMPMCDENYQTLMAPYITQPMVDSMVAEARENHTLDEFARECMCMSINLETAQFKRSYFRHYDEDTIFEQGKPALSQQKHIENIVIVDPARTVDQKTSCKTAISVIGLDLANNRFFLRDIIKGLYHPSKVTDAILNACQRWNASVLGVEKSGGDLWIQWPIESEMIRRSMFTPIVWLKPGARSKDMRAGMLENIYARGQMWHNTAIAHLIEPHLLSYPRPAEWDVVDTVAYLLDMLEEGKRYFTGGASEGETDASDLAAFAALDREPLYIGAEGELPDDDADYYSDELPTVGADRWMNDRSINGPRRQLPRCLTRYR